MTLFDPQKAREQYLERLLARYALVTLPIDSARQVLPLHTIFQPMIFRRDPLAPQQHGLSKTATDVIRAKDGAEALRKSVHGRMVVLGGPGMGKTTALKALLCTAITTAQADLSAPLPLFISLPDLMRAGLSFEVYISQILAELDVDARFAGDLTVAVHDGNAFLCLDSLDEVLPAQRPDVIAFLNREASRPGSIWIVGSRFTEYKGGQFAPGQFTEWELQALDEQERLILASQLLPTLYDALYGDMQQNLKPATPSAEAYIKDLQQHPQIAAWGENPLLFSLAAVSYTQTGRLPTSRAVLYAQVTEAMFAMRIHDAEQRVELRHLLAEMALAFYQTRGRNFSITDMLEFFPSLLSDQRASSVYDVIARVLDSGVLEPVADQIYGFKHQMFQEYLAAVALARRWMDPTQRQSTRDLLWRKRRLSRWKEILRLLVGILVQEHGAEGLEVAHNWLSALALENRTSEGDPGNLCLILAMQSLGELGDHVAETKVADLAKQILEIWEKTYTELVDLGRWSYTFTLNGQARVFSAFSLHLVAPAILRLQPYHLDTWDFCSLPASASVINRFIPIRTLWHLFENESISLYTCHTIHALQTPAVTERAAAVLENADGRWSVEDQVAVVRLLGELREQTPVALLIKTWQDTTLDDTLRQSAAESLCTAEIPVSLGVFVAMLHDSDSFIRCTAIGLLSKQGGQEQTALLVSALKDSDPSVREKVLLAIHELKVPLPIESLQTLFYDEYASVSEQACNCLLEMGEQVPLELWLDALQNEEYHWVRAGALRAIERYRDRVPVEALLDMFALHEKEGYRHLGVHADCIQALGFLGDRVPLDPLLESLQHVNEFIRVEALQVLTQRRVALPAHLLLPMLDSDIAGQAAVQAIAVLGEHAPISSLLALARSGVPYRVHCACQALRLLYQYVPTEPVLELLQDEEISNTYRDAYGELIQLLQLQGVEISLELLLPALKRSYIAFDLAPIVAPLYRAGAQAPIEPLLRLIYEETRGTEFHPMWIQQLFYVLYEWVLPRNLTNTLGNTPADQLLAVSLLGSVGDAESIQLLTEVAQDPARDRTTRCEAIVALNDLRVNLPLEYLLQATRWSIYDGMGSSLADTVERLGEQTPIERLLPLLGEDHNRLQPAVVEALMRIAGSIPLETLLPLLEDKKESVRHAALYILAARGERAPVELFAALLHNPEQTLETRCAALWALGEAGTSAAIDLLLEALADGKAGIRHSALSALKDAATKGSRGGIRVFKELPLEPLLRLLDDPDGVVVRSAIDVLGELASLGMAVPVEPLVSLLDHESEVIAGDAVAALCKFGEHAPVDALLAHMNDAEDEQVRSFTFFALSFLEAYAPLEAMLAALSDSGMTGWYMWQIESALENLASTRPEEMVKLLHDDPSPLMRRTVLKAIQATRACEWLPLVLDTLHDADGRYAAFDHDLHDTTLMVRYAVVKTLGSLSACAPIEPLLQMLDSNEWRYNFADEGTVVLKALREFGSRVPLSTLWPLLGSDQVKICGLAFRHLQEAHPDEAKELVPVLKAIARGEPVQGAFAARMQYRIAETVAAMGRATPAVLAMVTEPLDHPYWEVRARTAKTLGMLRRSIPDSAIRRLLGLRKDPESLDVRVAADQALAEILSLEQGMEDE